MGITGPVVFTENAAETGHSEATNARRNARPLSDTLVRLPAKVAVNLPSVKPDGAMPEFDALDLA